MPKTISMKRIPEMFENAENRLLDLACSPSGIIYEKHDSPYREASLTEECKYQLNEERISRMLAN